MPGPSFVIRDATAADLRGIFAIYNAEVLTGTATWDLEPRTEAEQLAWLKEHALPYCAIVAIEDATREVIGYGSLSRYKERPGYRFTVEDTVYVRPDRQRQGVGRALLAELVRRGKAGGYHAMLGRISGDNPASVGLHQALGFVEAGVEREVGFKFDQWLDVVTVELLLDD